jgi:phage tail sheath protein FI
VLGFFENGGRRCYVATRSGSDPTGAALEALAREKFSILCCPDDALSAEAAAKIAAYCERRKDLIGLLQVVPPLANPPRPPEPRSSYVACYHPQVVVAGPDGQGKVSVPAVGHVAGAYARLDLERGVHHTPSGVRLAGVLALTHEVSATEAESLVNHGINVLRDVPDRGIIVSGARTTSEDAEFRYVNVRRLLVFLEQSLVGGLQWAVFEPNEPVLWFNVARAIQDFLGTQWKSGALVGSAAAAAFFVRCDETTMTQDDLEAGRFVAIVGVAPLRPAEFVVLRITGQTARRDDDDDIRRQV